MAAAATTDAAAAMAPTTPINPPVWLRLVDEDLSKTKGLLPPLPESTAEWLDEVVFVVDEEEEEDEDDDEEEDEDEELVPDELVDEPPLPPVLPPPPLPEEASPPVELSWVAAFSLAASPEGG